MNKSELLKTEHEVQLKWLSNQVAKIANEGALAFKNPKSGERTFNKILKENMGVPSNSDIEHFVSIHLSETGRRKLVTTLRVYLKRNGTERLQVELTKNNKNLLDKLVKISGKTKIEIINQLIEKSLPIDFQKEEEQIELKTPKE